MKTLNIVLLLLVQLSCCNKLAIQETGTFPVKIEQAYYQSWVAGVRGGGSGTNFHIEFASKLSHDITLNQLYFRGKKNSIHKESENHYVIAFRGAANQEKGNELESDVPPTKEEITESPIPVSENEAILEFTQKGKRKWYKIKNVTEKEMLAYPSARPRN